MVGSCSKALYHERILEAHLQLCTHYYASLHEHNTRYVASSHSLRKPINEPLPRPLPVAVPDL